MTNPTDDFDERLRRAASEYNPPGETPRDRMWAEIRAQRAQRVVATPAAPTHRRPVWYMPVAVAAVLVLGIAIGRLYERLRPNNGRTVTASGIDTAHPSIVAHNVDSTSKPESLATPLTSAPRIVAAVPPDQRPPGRERLTTDSITGSRPNASSAATVSYQLAVVEHLAGTEAMLSSFRAAAKRGEVDAQITTWARNLLTTTRLLQASAAQEDPTMKRLLDDLELVLVQIAQYTSASPHRAEELELIEHSIERRGVIGKLHTTIPARLGPAGT
jgi:hypothetical protein